MAEEINKTYTSNSLYNDSTGVIAFAEQLKQELINWANYQHVTEELGQNRPDLQSELNNLFLSVYERFLTFLNDADASKEAINTWKEIENFLADYTDDKTLASIIAELNNKIESRLAVPLESTTGSSTTSTMTQKAITETIDASKTFTTGEKVDNVGIDSEPTVGSDNLVNSGGVADAIGLLGDVSNYEDNKRVNSSGSISNDESTFISTRIPVSNGDLIYWEYSNTYANVYLVEYDENGIPVAAGWYGMNGAGKRSFTISHENTAYIIATFTKIEGYTPQLKVNGVSVWSRKIEDGRVSVLEKRVDNTNQDVKNIKSNLLVGNVENFNPQIGYVAYDSNNKKVVSTLNQLRYIDLSEFLLKSEFIQLSNFSYTPSTGDVSTYTTIRFFDSEDNIVGEVTEKNSGDTMILSKPAEATQCYVDCPPAYINEVVVKLGDLITLKKLSETCFDSEPTLNSSKLLTSGIFYQEITPLKSDIKSIRGLSRFYFTGANNTFRNSNVELFGLIPGNKYRITPHTQYWDMSGVTIADNQAYFLQIYSIDSEENKTDLVAIYSRNARKQYYNIIIPSNSNKVLVGGRATSGVEVWFSIENITNITDTTPIVSRNSDKIPMLLNACRYRKTGSSFKDYQVLICTDMHGAAKANENAIDATNEFSTIDAYVNCGDIVGSNYAEPPARSTFATDFAKLSKPGYVVCGNHDVGNCYYVGYACNHAQAYESYIKPMVDKGFLVSGEYEVGKPYWYHDDSAHNIRIIGLYEYDDNLDLNETYWRAIEYDNSLSSVLFNTAYNVGDKVNAGSNTEYSFECVQAVTTPANYYTNPEKLPSYRVQRGTRVIRQTQAQWFLDTLANTPSNYGVIVIMHSPFSLTATTLDKKFSWPANQSGGDGNWTQNSMVNDFIRDSIVSFIDGTNYSDKIIMKGNASYLNVLNDGSINYAYQVSKDFSAKNSGVYFLGIIGGHAHRDFIWKDSTKNIYQISPNCAKVDGANDRNGDIRRAWSDELSYDSLTVASFAQGRIGLVKLGVNVTENGTMRDFEVIDTSN